jgi:hypothetical protein
MPQAQKTLTIFAALAVLAAGPAAAQADRDAAFVSALSQVQAAVIGSLVAAGPRGLSLAGAPARPAPQRLLESTLTAMNDGPATAGLLVSWLRDQHAVVEFSAAAQGRSSHVWLAGKPAESATPAVYLAADLAAAPLSCRYVAVFVAREAAELMLKDFPESAEKRYIVASRMAETFFELGGTRATMGDIDGHHDEQAESAIRLWVENDPVSGVALLKSQGSPTLAEIRAKASSDDQKTAAADAASREFASFRAQEKDWLMQNQGMLQ